MAKAFSTALLLLLASSFGGASAKNSVDVLYRLQGGSEGCNPGGMVSDAAGAFYGVAYNCGDANNGTVFRFTPGGKFRVLNDFADPHAGSHPQARLLLGPHGTLFGTAQMGGDGGQGTVFEVKKNGDLIVLHAFTGGADGGTPLGGLVSDAQGNLYGTASVGGKNNDGVVYKISHRGEYHVMHSFDDLVDGSTPSGELLADGNGNFYGTTQKGTLTGAGDVYKIAADGKVTIIYAFAGGHDGFLANGSLIADAAGNLYGTTSAGGSVGIGIVFKIAPDGTETILHDFDGYQNKDGGRPLYGLAWGSDGALYGVTDVYDSFQGRDWGDIFRIDTAGDFQLLVKFPKDDKKGYVPSGALILGPDGNLYGTLDLSPPDNAGTVFELPPGLHSPRLTSSVPS